MGVNVFCGIMLLFVGKVFEKGKLIIGLSGLCGGEDFYIFMVINLGSVVVFISGGMGDVDLYVKVGSKFIIFFWDCCLYCLGNVE